MTDDSMLRVHRAISDLRLGSAIALEGPKGTLWLRPAEAADSANAAHISELSEAWQAAATWLVTQAGWLPRISLSYENSTPSAAQALPLTAIEHAMAAPPALVETTPKAAALPNRYHEHTQVRAFRDIHSGLTHLAILMGEPASNAQPPLCRLHSSCLTGDILASLRCDCGDQLDLALTTMADEGCGVLLYLDQEGRGIGIGHKLHAYHLQDQGMDTVDANEALGFAADGRDFRLAADILKRVGIPAVRLLSNNPRKAATLGAEGITITATLPLKPRETEHNKTYLATKRSRLGHC